MAYESFQSAPETGASGGVGAKPSQLDSPVSIRSRDRSLGRAPQQPGHGEGLHVSIRSRDRSLGRVRKAIDQRQAEVVSIRSRDRSLGRVQAVHRIHRFGQFQSAPETGASGGQEAVPAELAVLSVSIRSRDRSLGRVTGSTTHISQAPFQSAPETGASGGALTSRTFTRLRCFNPLPRPEPREGSTRSGKPGTQRFNPLPRPEPREGSGSRTESIQPRFQSAPETGASGGRAGTGGYTGTTGVSIRSRDRSLGRARLTGVLNS